MMDPSEDVCKSLIKWLQTLVTNRTRSVVEICDGVAILEALLQIAPENFHKLQSKIKTDVASNWRLKLSNLKKIVEAITEYYQDILNIQLMDIGRPDVFKLGETNDIIQLGKLLRLLLGCAVNCERKQDYITQIMALEESVQQCIMQAIQQLEELAGGPGRSGLSLLSLDNDTRILRLASELETANEAKDTLAQQCHNLESKVHTLQEEKQVLLTDNQLLVSQIREKPSSENYRGLDVNRRQLDLLKEEVFKLETIRDDNSAKMMDQDKQIVLLQEKIADLQLASEATARLKDEVDALSESADKVQALEIAVASYKKKLEDYTDTKKQLKMLEDKNVEYLQQTLKYEEELKKHNVWKNQADLYKNQAAELQQKLDEETQRLDKAVFVNKNLESKLEASQAEKQRTARERDALREENEELRLGTREDGAAMAQELAPSEMSERLRHLERENRALRSSNQDVESRQVLLDDAIQRLEKLTELNRTANQKILEFEAILEDQKLRDHSSGSHPNEGNIKELAQKNVMLQEAVSVKDNEIRTLQMKQARYLEKAKEVSLNLDTKTNGSVASIRHNQMKEHEERLITTAFYKLSLACHREAVDERLAVLSAGQGATFLQRQRQSMPGKSSPNFKSK